MSTINRISNEAVIPRVETRLFDDQESARFAVGVLAVGNEVRVGLEEEYKGYLRLRANVYADQTGFISRDQVQADGTEIDADDARSVHFGIIEKNGAGGRVVGALRVIVKEDDQPLPIEKFYPEAFETPAALNSNEASRYICRHENPRIQETLSHPLFSAAVTYVMARGLRPTYGVVEAPLETSLRSKQVPITRITEPRYLPEYATENVGIEVDTGLLEKVMELRNPGIVNELRHNDGRFTYFGKVDELAGGAVA